jgi:hypothetical protein
MHKSATSITRLLVIGKGAGMHGTLSQKKLAQLMASAFVATPRNPAISLYQKEIMDNLDGYFKHLALLGATRATH